MIKNIIYWIFLFALILAISFTRCVDVADESFFLQVANRIAEGELLYRDIFIGVTPLSPYILAFFIKIFSCDLLIARTLLSLYLFLHLFTLDRIFQHLHIPYRKLLLLTVLACSHPSGYLASAAYTSLSYLFFILTLLHTLKRNFILASFFCAFAILSKQTVGFFLLLALLVTLFHERCSKKILTLFFILSLTSLLFLPLFLNIHFLDCCFLNKGKYLSLGRQPYFTHFSLHPYSCLTYLMPIIASLSLLFRWRLFLYQRSYFIIALFFLASFLSTYPRFDQEHLTFIFPLAFLVFAIFLFEHPIIHPNFLLTIILHDISLLISLVAIVHTTLQPLKPFCLGILQRCNLPHFHVGFINTDAHNHYKRLTEEYPKQTKTLFLSTKAGFYYLITDSKNPTPFDYPIYPALREKHETLIIDLLTTGGIKTVLTDYENTSCPDQVLPKKTLSYIQNTRSKKEPLYPFTHFSP